MPTDPKPPARVQNPKLLREIHAAYKLSGCAHCGNRRWVEVHHIKSRAQGGDDSWENCVGLCGERGGCRAHKLVHDRVWSLWLDREGLWLDGVRDMVKLKQLGVR